MSHSNDRHSLGSFKRRWEVEGAKPGRQTYRLWVGQRKGSHSVRMRTPDAAGRRGRKGGAESCVVPGSAFLLSGLRGRGLLTSFVLAPPRPSTRFGSRLVLPVCCRCRDDINWFISDKDIEAQIANNRSRGRCTQRYYSANKNIICRNCDKRGHLSKNCPLPPKVRSCFLCSEKGHLLYACPAPLCEYCPVPKMLDHSCIFRRSWDKQCDRCHMLGHYTDACTEIWRQYHLTTKPGPPKKPKTTSRPSALAYCYHCAQKGHYGHECPEREVYDPSPVSPFICYYDDKYEIREREKRLKQKIKVLKKNRDFPEPSMLPYIEGANENLYHDTRKGCASRKSNRWPQENKDTQKEMKNKNRNWGKHRKADRHREVNEDYPRGPKTYSSLGSFKTQKSSRPFHRSSHYHTSREDKYPKEGKRGKQKKKKCLEDDDNDNLFLIKQRKKKS
ncbi:zinc finger CCHC domain-containing protein 7 isoform X2 [Callithrix jacchus]